MPLRLVDYVRKVQSLVHDSTGSAWSRAEMLARINDARKDVSLDCQCVRSLVTGVQLMPRHERYGYDGAVVGARLTDPGEGYPPGQAVRVTFSAPPRGGQHAMGFAVPWRFGADQRPPEIVGPGPQPAMSSLCEEIPRWERGPWLDEIPACPGGLAGICMTQWGRRYSEAPQVVVEAPPGGGRRATAEAITLLNVVNVITISPLWNTLRYTLSYKSFSVYQSWARALQAQGFTSRPGIWTLHQGDQLIYTQPTPDQTYDSEWDVVRLAAPLRGLEEIDRDIADPWAQLVEWKAAAYLLMKHQNFGQAEYYERKYDARVPRIVAGAGGVRIQNPYSRAMYEKMRRV